MKINLDALGPDARNRYHRRRSVAPENAEPSQKRALNQWKTRWKAGTRSSGVVMQTSNQYSVAVDQNKQ
jgi:hypothetical protein